MNCKEVTAWKKDLLKAIDQVDRLRKENASLTAERNALREAWVSVGDRLPEMQLLCAVTLTDNAVTFGQLWRDDVWLVYQPIDADIRYFVNSNTERGVTHWKPLTPPDALKGAI